MIRIQKTFILKIQLFNFKEIKGNQGQLQLIGWSKTQPWLQLLLFFCIIKHVKNGQILQD